MAIKVKHEGSVASRVAASAAGGAAKRAMDAAALAKGRDIQQKQAASASAAAAPSAHAQLIYAPSGSAHAPLVHGGPISTHATIPGGGSGGRGAGGAVRTGMGSGAEEDLKITGYDRFSRPDMDSQWSEAAGRWVRAYYPGEKEAEVKKRVGMAENEVLENRQLTEHGRKERAALVGDITKAIKDGKFSQDEIPGLMREFGIAEDQIRMADALREREPTAREQFMKNTFTDERGIIFSPDGKVLYNPQETELRRLDALRTRADNFEKELRKPRKITSTDENGVPSDNYVERTEEEISAIMQKRFPELYPASQVQEQTPTATPTPQNPVETPDPAADNPGDPLAAFKKYKN